MARLYEELVVGVETRDASSFDRQLIERTEMVLYQLSLGERS
jgi:hypothetical protein